MPFGGAKILENTQIFLAKISLLSRLEIIGPEKARI